MMPLETSLVFEEAKSVVRIQKTSSAVIVLAAAFIEHWFLAKP